MIQGQTGDCGLDDDSEPTEKVTDMVMKIDGVEVPVIWEDNASVEALSDMGDLTIEMSMCGSNSWAYMRLGRIDMMQEPNPSANRRGKTIRTSHWGMQRLWKQSGEGGRIF